MTAPIIEVHDLGKQYQIGEIQKNQSIADGLKALPRALANQALTVMGQRDRKQPHTIWALRNVNLSINQGEVVGIIGHNGAGKSTLLKVLTRITTPTEGYAQLRGRVGSLLEVGTGFQGMLSGRENVYLNGAIIGMTRDEINSKFDDIVEFSGVGEFIDTPVRHYSSGMYLRLAFAVASHLEPEILLVDEVLAVGDAAFQKKCLGEMNDVAERGRTVVFVSHNMAAIESLCQRVIWMDHGTIRADGPARQVINQYLQTTVSQSTHKIWNDRASAPSHEGITMHQASVFPTGGTPDEPITVGDPFNVAVEYWNERPNSKLMISLTIVNEENVFVFSSATIHEPNWHGRMFEQGLYRSVVQVPAFLLNKGNYRAWVVFMEDEGERLWKLEDILSFDIADTDKDRGNYFGDWNGVVRPWLDWKTEYLVGQDTATIAK